jgi:NAD(P)-dependent dehydrogenase (short-subunit alcohol dehydrogenase family)
MSHVGETLATADDLYVLITGASSGIGQAIAVRLSNESRLVLHGRDVQRLEDTRSRCAHPDRHLIWPYDLRETGGLAQSLCDFIKQKSIGIESFIHSAGILKILPIRSVDCQTLGEVMNVNFVSASAIISHLVKKKVNGQRLRSVLLISSIASNFGAPGFSMYSARKGALDGLMRALAIELAPAVRVNSLLPGAIKTPMTTEMLADPEVQAKFNRDYPLGLGEVDDIVNAAIFLVSEQAKWITGQQIIVDGGRTANISI